MSDSPVRHELSDDEARFLGDCREGTRPPEAVEQGIGPLVVAQGTLEWWRSLDEKDQPDPDPILYCAGVALGDEVIAQLKDECELSWCLIEYPDGDQQLSVADPDGNIILTPTHTVLKHFDSDEPANLDQMSTGLVNAVRRMNEKDTTDSA